MGKKRTVLVEIPRPINGNPQNIVRSESRYDLNKTSFSPVINSVEVTDANSNYKCFLNVVNPLNSNASPTNLLTDFARLKLIVNGKSLICILLKVV